MSTSTRSAADPERGTGTPEPGRGTHCAHHLSSNDVEAIKAAHPLADFATRYGIQLARSGPRFVALCPFHDETRPSFTIFPASNRWWCFGCRRGGDVIDLVRLLEGVTFCKAVVSLGGSNGTIHSGRSHSPTACAPHAVHGVHREHAERWLAARASAHGQRALDVAVECYVRELEESVAAQRYLARRDISDTLARACSLGYSSGTRLRDTLRGAGVPLRVAWDVGLLVGREGAERFAGRITIPEVRTGHACWLTGRLLDDRDDAPRYMSLPGARPLLGAERVAGQPVVVGTEGPFDYLTLTAWGIPAFAALGGSLSPVALADLHAARVVYLAFDRDTPGQQAARTLARRLDGRARLVVLPVGVKDVNELGLRPAGRLVFQACVIESARGGVWPERRPPEHPGAASGAGDIRAQDQQDEPDEREVA